MKTKNRPIQTSVRMSEEVNRYIWRMGEKSFSSNLEAMVLFCMKREEILYQETQRLEKRKAELIKEIQEQEQLLADLADLRNNIQLFIGKFERIGSAVYQMCKDSRK